MERVPSQETGEPKNQHKWNEKVRDLESIVDALGSHIEDGIKETVAGLQLLGFNTTGSCEGHNNWGSPYPWVQMNTGGEPKYRWEGEKEMREIIAAELHIASREIEQSSPQYDFIKWEKVDDIFHERLPDNAPETKEYIAWIEKNRELANRLEFLIKKFYSTDVPNAKLPRVTIQLFFAGSEPRLLIDDEKRKDDEEEIERIIKEKKIPSTALIERVSRRQTEMKRFPAFLKHEFFSSQH